MVGMVILIQFEHNSGILSKVSWWYEQRELSIKK